MSEKKDETLSRLEEEGEVAADYLEELLDIADLDGDIEIDVENGRASVEIVADDATGLENLKFSTPCRNSRAWQYKPSWANAHA